MRPASLPYPDPAAAPGPTGARADVLVLLCTSVPAFMLQLDATSSRVAAGHRPLARRQLRRIEWVVTAYMLSFAALLLPAGALADRFGRKRLLVSGLGFSPSPRCCAARRQAPGAGRGRALQGAGAAMALSASLAALSHAVQRRGPARAFAFWGSVIGVGMASGRLSVA